VQEKQNLNGIVIITILIYFRLLYLSNDLVFFNHFFFFCFNKKLAKAVSVKTLIDRRRVIQF